jgi:hypothetical protein
LLHLAANPLQYQLLLSVGNVLRRSTDLTAIRGRSRFDISAFLTPQIHTYANHAVVGTLSLMLVLVNNLEWTEAYQQAEQMWLNRDKKWPITLPEAESQAAPFDTTGKHYTH